MNFLSNLPKTTTRSRKRVGRGIGSGVGGHTVGRGQKGQKSRSKLPLLFTGTKNKKSLIQRMPVLRGKGRFKSLKPKPLLVKLSDLEGFKKNDLIDVDLLAASGVVNVKDARKRGVKVLGDGKLTKALSVKLVVSEGAKAAIEGVGGKVISE